MRNSLLPKSRKYLTVGANRMSIKLRGIKILCNDCPDWDLNPGPDDYIFFSKVRFGTNPEFFFHG